uniref:CCHC-type domain-containing protein n=1 Tax=Noctiluca scintillans TaxID=2966 RepID=A0A7S1FD03_NOCSC
MPATAGRVSMPNSNRLSVSDSLKTHEIWQSSVKYDPYAGTDEDTGNTAIPELGEINSSAKGLFRLAQLTGNSSTLAPGACKKCGQVGHLWFQCRNYMNVSKEEKVDEDDPSSDIPDSDEDDSSSDNSNSDESESSDQSESDSSSDDKKKKNKSSKKSVKKNVKKKNKEKKRKHSDKNTQKRKGKKKDKKDGRSKKRRRKS